MRYAPKETLIMLSKDGTRTMIHRNGNKYWEHPDGDPYQADGDEMRPCPECSRKR